jgi:hypothetical protein
MQQEISLYIDLLKDRKLDLETAGRAAIAFDAALKEIAFTIDPFATIKVELESGTEGSLSLNSIISSTRLDKAKLRAIALAILAFFGAETATYTYDHVLDWITSSPDAHEHLSKEEIEGIAKEVAKVIQSKAAEKHVGKIYQELQRDDSVRGAGISQHHGQRPPSIVPRSEFGKRGRIVHEIEATGIRSETSVQTLTLISPVLVHGSKRKWKFRHGKIEFGAPIKDEKFLTRVLSGREPVPMSDGITMKVVLTVKEERVNGAWQIKDRTIDEVIEIAAAPEQVDLFGPAAQQDDDAE